MASGVKVCDSTVEAYKELKLKKNIRYMLMYVDEATGLIKVESSKLRDNNMSQEDEYKEFLSKLPPNVGRYCLVDLLIPQKSGQDKDQLFLITWCPDGASMKSNMLYTTSQKALTKKIQEGTKAIQANDLGDLDYQELLGTANK